MAQPPKHKWDPTRTFTPRNNISAQNRPQQNPSQSQNDNRPRIAAGHPQAGLPSPPSRQLDLPLRARSSWATVAAGGPRTPHFPHNVQPIPASVIPSSMPVSGQPQVANASPINTPGNQAGQSTTKPPAKRVPRSASTGISGHPSGEQAAMSGKLLLANHFSIKLGQHGVVYSYPIEIVFIPKSEEDKPGKRKKSGPPGNPAPSTRPASVAKPKKKRLIQMLLNTLRDHRQLTNPVATDYQKELITTAKLTDTVANGEYDIVYYDEYAESPNQNSPTYRVKFGQPKSISLTNLFAHYRQSNNIQLSDDDVTAGVNALNIIFSYLPYQSCFAPDRTMTTVKGQRFYGIPDFSQPRGREDNWQTPTGPVIGRKDAPLLTVPGFVRSVRPTFSGTGYVDLNIYTKTGSFWRHDTVQELINAWERSHHDGTFDQLQEFLHGAPVVMVSREDDLDPFFGIRGLARIDEMPSADKCPMLHPKQQCHGQVRLYYESHHNWHFNRNIYVVKVGQKKDGGPLTIPADLLQVIPGKLKPGVIPTGGAMLPEENHDRIVDLGRRTFFSPDPNGPGATAFDLRLDTSLASVPVTRLPEPVVTYRTRGNLKNKLMVKKEKLKTGQWDMEKAAFGTPAKGQKWTCVELMNPASTVCCTPKCIDDFAYHLEGAFKDYGMSDFEWWQFEKDNMIRHQCKDPRFLPRSKTMAALMQQEHAVEELLQELKKHNVTLVILLLPSQDPDLYSAIKRAGDQVCGIATVCHVLKSIETANQKRVLWPKSPRVPHSPPHLEMNKNKDFLGNLCLKVNLKVEEIAVNQSLQQYPALLTTQTMIIGIDVAHAGGPRRGCPSIAAVVGSVNQDFSQYPASIGINPCIADDDGQPQANEEVMDLEKLMLERLREYHDRNHGKGAVDEGHNGIPTQLVVYRDGVSESQFEMCGTNEYNRIREAVTKFLLEKGRSADQELPVTLICAIKRHHTRIFRDPKTAVDEDVVLNESAHIKSKPWLMNNNPLPGTLVQDRITYGHGNDFFLIAHKAIQGTAIPVHYNVLQNPCNYSLRDIAKMTYDLCFLFGRSRTSVGLCTPVYYADLVTARARCYVRDRWYSPPKDPDHKIKPFDLTAEKDDFENALRIHPDMAGKMFYI